MRIKELREEKNLSQEAVAIAVQTSQRNIGRWENEENEPTCSFLIKLSKFFNVSIDYLVGNSDEFGYINVNGTPMSTLETELLYNFKQLDLFQQETVLTQVKALTKVKR